MEKNNDDWQDEPGRRSQTTLPLSSNTCSMEGKLQKILVMSINNNRKISNLKIIRV